MSKTPIVTPPDTLPLDLTWYSSRLFLIKGEIFHYQFDPASQFSYRWQNDHFVKVDHNSNADLARVVTTFLDRADQNHNQEQRLEEVFLEFDQSTADSAWKYLQPETGCVYKSKKHNILIKLETSKSLTQPLAGRTITAQSLSAVKPWQTTLLKVDTTTMTIPPKQPPDIAR